MRLERIAAAASLVATIVVVALVLAEDRRVRRALDELAYLVRTASPSGPSPGEVSSVLRRADEITRGETWES